MEISAIDLNGYIEALVRTRGHDQEAREALARYAAENMEVTDERAVHDIGPGDQQNIRTTGYTAEAGNVSVQNAPERKKVTSRKTEKHVRVGKYSLRLIKHEQFGLHLIADAADAVEMIARGPQGWAMGLDEKHNPLWFGEQGGVEAEYSRRSLSERIGEIRARGWKNLFKPADTTNIAIYASETWGRNIGSRHYFALYNIQKIR